MSEFDYFKSGGTKRKFFETLDSPVGSKESTPVECDIRARLEEIVGPLGDEHFRILEPLARTKLELAVNKFFDGSLATPDDHTNTVPLREGNELFVDDDEPLVVPETAVVATVDPKTVSNLIGQLSDSTSEDFDPVQFEKKSLGSFQAEIWCTRSGKNLVQFGDKLAVRRIAAQSSKEDHVVRLHTLDGRDFARIRENDAKFMAVLIDTGVCEFVATCIYAEPVLRLGDAVIVQIDAYFLRSAFEVDVLDARSATVSTQPKGTIVDESKETNSEMVMRLRQLGLVQLFSRLSLMDARIPDINEALEQINTAISQSEEPEHSVSTGQMNMLYKNSARKELAEANPGDSFALSLYPYQKQALQWMLQRESGSKIPSSMLHPLWTRFEWPDKSGYFYANMHSGELSLELPTLEDTNMGGILADEMGLGKTITTLSLVHTTDAKLTLIVAPMSLLSQWESEVRRSAKAKTVHCLVYYGGGVNELSAYVSMISNYPKTVVTSYGVLVSEHKQLLKFREKNGLKTAVNSRQDGPSVLGLYGVRFDRLVLDEAHTIKNRNTRTAKACYDINAAKRWALTGTPIVNRLEDLYSLIKFLKVEPWNNFSFWKAFITAPFETADGAEDALKIVQSIIAPLCLRRTKDMKQNGKPLVSLPDKVVEVRRVAFSEDERRLYSHIYARVRTSVAAQVKNGTVNKSYTALLTKILRLRQVCCHPYLLRSRKPEQANPEDESIEVDSDVDNLVGDESITALVDGFSLESAASLDDKFPSEVMQSLVDSKSVECPICCTDPIPLDDQGYTECFHVACLDCILRHIDYQKAKGYSAYCFACRAPIHADRLYTVTKRRDGTAVLQRYQESRQSAKVKALVRELKQTKGRGKSVVFSQFTSFLDIIEQELARQGFPTVRMDGTMNQQKRTEVLEYFRNFSKDIILLLSLKVGGVGLNLVCARQAFLMDPWWSYAVEAQAIDRIHRMGQTENVRVVRFIVEGTLDERMLQIQERKRALSSVITEEERKDIQLENIKVLFELDKV
ncbi:DNA repair protein RAD5 [Wickerhamiella sorbophila]|uniref:DNA repair protein RAD5 n=1 Tax=Wickerhamiella sorbophila TaxID=45607 RepID=A0A2T0FM40_9ASCO|nr:DNA repair protein RAD5 [Wickerhamiella sorbophila]PRT56052.1 DNA repair protein RAD5 [Wickerhamiella sorbophila]